MGRVGLIALLLLLMAASLSSAQPVIVEAGESRWAIYSPADASAAEKLAAEEVARYIRAMSGAQLPIVHDRMRENLLIVAAEANVGHSVPGNFVRLDGPDDYNVVAAANGVWICGTTGAATLNAAYQFLEALGCRFLAPQLEHYHGSAEVVPKTPTIRFTAGAITARPALRYRKLYVEEGHSHDAQNLRQMAEWMPKVGYNVLVIPTDYQGNGRVRWDNWRDELTPVLQQRGIIIEVGGHGYQNFLNAEMEQGKPFERHPEWFGQDEQGQRRREKGWVFCTSTAAARDYMIANLLSYLQQRPEIEIFDFWPPDGARWCHCEPCLALGTPSDRQAILAGQVLQRLQPVRPDLRLEVLAYQTSIVPPQSAKLDPRILVDFCPIRQQFDVQIHDESSEQNREYVQGLRAWRQAFAGDISIYSYYRKYAWDSLPIIIPHYMQRDLRWYITMPVQGISSYAEPGDWFTYELNHYALAHLAREPEIDVDALVSRFCEARYGPAAAVAQQTLLGLQDIIRTYCAVPHVPMKSADDIANAKQRLQAMHDQVREAAGQSQEDGVKHNLRRLELMCRYALDDLQIQHLRATKQPREQVLQRVADLHAFVSQHADEGVFLVRNHRLSLPRMQTRYGVPERENRPAGRRQRNQAAAPQPEAAPE